MLIRDGESYRLSFAWLESRRPRGESARGDRRPSRIRRSRKENFFLVRNRASRLSGATVVSELRGGSGDFACAAAFVARAARNRNAAWKPETVCKRAAATGYGHSPLRRRDDRFAGIADSPSANAAAQFCARAARGDCARSEASKLDGERR